MVSIQVTCGSPALISSFPVEFFNISFTFDLLIPSSILPCLQLWALARWRWWKTRKRARDLPRIPLIIFMQLRLDKPQLSRVNILGLALLFYPIIDSKCSFLLALNMLSIQIGDRNHLTLFQFLTSNFGGQVSLIIRFLQGSFWLSIDFLAGR